PTCVPRARGRSSQAAESAKSRGGLTAPDLSSPWVGCTGCDAGDSFRSGSSPQGGGEVVWPEQLRSDPVGRSGAPEKTAGEAGKGARAAVPLRHAGGGLYPRVSVGDLGQPGIWVWHRF